MTHPSASEYSGGTALLEALFREGVEYIFGYPGGAALHIYDALHNQDRIRHILVRHEQGATHAADGYARATGKVGVVLVTSGPGVTNSITGLATAYMDSAPIVVISGQVPSRFIGSDAFQEVDSVGISRPVVKHNFLVKAPQDIPRIIREAFYIASSGRPGPVLVDIPKDMTDPKQLYKMEFPESVNIRSYHPPERACEDDVSRAAEWLVGAERPMIYTGGGIVFDGSSQVLADLLDSTGFPITSTLMGLGCCRADREQFLGMLGMHGTYEANMAMHECDILLAIGARFDDRVTGEIDEFCPDARIIHIDIDPSSVSKNVQVDLPLIGSAGKVMQQLIGALEALKAQGKAIEPGRIKPWWERIAKWRSRKCLSYENSDKVIKPQYVLECLDRLIDEDTYVTSDVGQHQMWAAQYINFQKPRRWINSGGLGTMGFGLPAAMGVKIAQPERDVVCVTGEASVIMCIQELSTCLQYDAHIKIVNLNNRYMGMVRQWQEFFYDSRYSHSYLDALPDFCKLAESFGHVGMRIEDPAEVEGSLQRALAMRDRAVFLDFITDQTENVFPMIQSGAGHHKMVLGAPGARELS